MMNPAQSRGPRQTCRRCGGPIQRPERVEARHERAGGSLIEAGWNMFGMGLAALWVGAAVATAPISAVVVAGGLVAAGGAAAAGGGLMGVIGGVGVNIAEGVLQQWTTCSVCGNPLLTTQNESRTPNEHVSVPVYKCKRKNFTLPGGELIPEGVGIFFDRFEKTLLEDVMNDLAIGTDGLMACDKIDKKINAFDVTVEMKESQDEWIAKCDTAFVKALEDKYKIVLQSSLYETELPQYDGPGDDNEEYGFERKDIKLEGVDKRGNYVVKFCNSNITTYPAEAMVNSSNPKLAFNGILSGKVGEEAGPDVVEECKEFIKCNGDLTFCEVFVSKGGNLDFKYIIHVASPVWPLGRKHNSGPDELLITATKNILREADAKNMREIATPAISAGGFNYSMEVSLMSIFTGIDEYFKESDITGMLKYITLVDINSNITKEVEDAMKKIFGTQHVFDEEAKRCKNGNSVTCKIIGGSEEIVVKVIKELKDKCDGVFGTVVNYPATWAPMPPGEPYRLEELPYNSVDYMQLKDIVTKYIPKASIKKIERVQHPKLYDDLMAYKNHIITETGGWEDRFEMKLWHGTSKKAADKIKLDTLRKPTGKLTHGNGYGRGIYFGPDPEVSNQYSIWQQDADGTRYLFRCTVMVGKINKYEHSKDASSEATQAPPGHHSIQVLDPHFGMEHIVFEEKQACPDYLITYTA